METENRVALVTGASRGIGAAVAERLSAAGADVAALESESVVWARDLEGTGARLSVLLPGGDTETGMIPTGLPEGAREGLSRPEVVVGAAVYPASDDSRHLTGHRIVATEWSPEDPEGLGT